MYVNGLSFPIFNIFLSDGSVVTDLSSIINRKKMFLVENEEKTNDSIIEFINLSKGYEIYPFLLNNFDYLIQSDFKITKKKIACKFVKKAEFTFLINSFKINFIKIGDLLAQLDEVGIIDYSVFYPELHSLLYKRFAIKLGEVINYSDSEGSELFLDFQKDFKLFEEYSAELETTRPNLVRKFDYKKQYVLSFYKSFNSKDVDDILNKIEILKNHTDYEIIKTFRNLIKKSFLVNEGVNPKSRNKAFKPIYKEINSAINGKVYTEHNQTSLTKEVKRFFSEM